MQDNRLTEEAARARLALTIEAKKREGLSFSEIAALVTTPARPLTRNAVLGIYKRLEKQRIEDARDLKILDHILDKALPLDRIAKAYEVSVEHVRALKNEAAQ